MKLIKYRTEVDEDRKNILVHESTAYYNANSINSDVVAADILKTIYRLDKLAEEHVYVLALSKKNVVIGVFELSHGNVDSSLVSPRELFIRLLLVGAVNFILAHNHPSGNCAPSRDDIVTTKKIKECSEMMGIQLMDHIIIGEDAWFSITGHEML